MKRILQSMSFLFAGMLIFSACTEEKTGKSPEKIADKIEAELDSQRIEEIIQDSIPTNSIEIEEPPAPPEPIPEPIPEPLPPILPGPEPIPGPLPPVTWPNPIRNPVPINPIVDFTEVEPTFPGGTEKLMKFISEEVEYPEIDKEVGNQGRVFVEFVVERDGSLTNVKVLRGVSATIDREALRVVRLMPNWKPGEVGGKVVRCRSRLPITFRLD